MRMYRIISICVLCVCFSTFFINFQNRNTLPTVTENRGKIQDYQVPFNLVNQFYQAIEKNDWGTIKTLVSPILWAEMHRFGFRQKWESLLKNDPTIDFVMFLVVDQKINDNWSWVIGRVDWRSSRQKIADENVTLFFIKNKGDWKISSIRANLPIDIIDSFYQSINEGEFKKLATYFSKNYWNLLTKSGVIASLKKDWKRNKTGVYSVFYLKDFGITQNEAWVKGDVLWNPLTEREKETPVTIFLTNDEGWKIRKIVGHWEIKK